RSAFDRISARPQPVARRLGLVGLEALALPAQRLGTEDRAGEIAPSLVQLRPDELEDRRLMTRLVPRLRAVLRALKSEIEARLVDLERRDAITQDRIRDLPS